MATLSLSLGILVKEEGVMISVLQLLKLSLISLMLSAPNLIERTSYSGFAKRNLLYPDTIVLFYPTIPAQPFI
jgi:hypothetical protein